MSTDTQSNRHIWAFPVRAAAVAKAALKSQQHHERRARWWEDSKTVVMQKIKDGGIDVSESMMALYGQSSIARQPTVTINAELQQQIAECHQKIKEHESKARDYAVWAEFLADNVDEVLMLKHEDWVFFFGADHDQAAQEDA